MLRLDSFTKTFTL